MRNFAISTTIASE